MSSESSASASSGPANSTSNSSQQRPTDAEGDESFGIFPQRVVNDDPIVSNRDELDESFSSGRNYQGHTNSSNDNYIKNLMRALQLQTGLLILENSLITYEDAKKFFEQAVVQGDAVALVGA